MMLKLVEIHCDRWYEYRDKFFIHHMKWIARTIRLFVRLSEWTNVYLKECVLHFCQRWTIIVPIGEVM